MYSPIIGKWVPSERIVAYSSIIGSVRIRRHSGTIAGARNGHISGLPTIEGGDRHLAPSLANRDYRYLLDAFAAALSWALFFNSACVSFTCPTDCPMITLPLGTLSSCDHRWKMIPSVVATRSATSLAFSGGISCTCTRPVAISCLWSCQFLFQAVSDTAPVRVMDLAMMYSTCSRRAPGSLEL